MKLVKLKMRNAGELRFNPKRVVWIQPDGENITKILFVGDGTPSYFEGRVEDIEALINEGLKDS